jgi:hypothetical protein
MAIKSFTKVKRYLNSISGIGNGGCALSALAMYRWLKKNNKLTPETYFYYCYLGYCDESFYKQNARALENKDRPTGCMHAILYHKNKYFDCEKLVDISQYKWLQKIVDEKFVVESFNNIDCWNNMFNRDCISEIQRILDIDLSDIVLE